MKKSICSGTVGGRGWLPEELLEAAKSSRVMQSLRLDLGRPVPCEQGAADLWVAASSADHIFRFLWFYCVRVFGFMRLWDCGVVSLWACGLVFCRFVRVCVYVFVFVCALCTFA